MNEEGRNEEARIRSRLDRIEQRLREACDRSSRELGGVRLVAVAKTVPAETVRAAVRAGVTDVGENYVAELVRKREALIDIDRTSTPPGWHFVGTLQSHTAARLAGSADMVQTAVPGRALKHLAARARSSPGPLPVLVQVDFTGGRHGVAPERLEAALDEVDELAGLRLRGLMTLPPEPERPDDSRPYFARLRELRDRLQAGRPDFTELSMGMSLDYEAAVEEGATIVRIGNAIFGERPLVREGN